MTRRKFVHYFLISWGFKTNLILEKMMGNYRFTSLLMSLFTGILLGVSGSATAQFNPDFFPDFTADPGNPIIKYGDGFADAAWNDPSVIKVDGQYIMYTTAAEGIFLSDSNEVKVYRQVSSDGINWNLSPLTPVLEPLDGTYYEGGTETPSVVFKDGVYHLYLTCYPPGNDPFTYVLAHAVSSDGLTWTMDELPILESTLTDVFYSEIVAEPGALVYHDSIFVFFTASGIVDGSVTQGIGCIKSADGAVFGAPVLEFSLPTDVYETDDFWGLSTPAAMAMNDTIYVFTDVAQTIDEQWTQVALHQFKTDGVSGIWYNDDLPIHHMQDFPWTDGDYLSNLLAPSALLDEGGLLRIWYAGQNIASFVGEDTIYNVTVDLDGTIHVLPEFYGIGTSSYQFPYLSVDENVVDAEAIRVYPNPTNGMIQFNLPVKGESAVVKVINLQGKVVKNVVYSNDQICVMSLDDLEEGIYLIQIQQSSVTQTLKVELVR